MLNMRNSINDGTVRREARAVDVTSLPEGFAILFVVSRRKYMSNATHGLPCHYVYLHERNTALLRLTEFYAEF